MKIDWLEQGRTKKGMIRKEKEQEKFLLCLFITLHTSVVLPTCHVSKTELFKKRNLAAPLSFYAKMSTAVVFYRWLCGEKSYHAWLSTLSPPLVKFLCCIP